MTTTSPSDLRTDRARFLAAGAGQWLKCYTRAGKRYGIESQRQPGTYHLANTRTCSCPDFAHRQQACKHVLAVQLHVARVRAEQAQKEVIAAA